MDSTQQLNPTHELIIDQAIENITKKLIAGHRNKSDTLPKGSKPGIETTVKNTLKTSSAESAMEVANRGTMWKEMISKSFSHGITSLATLQFDSEFAVKGGKPIGLDSITNSPGVYVVHDKNGTIRYIGDAKNVQKRWKAGHLNENRQKEKAGEAYKLNQELSEGCIVKVINCESIETAAALEAKLIKEARDSSEYDVVNAKEELKDEQGKRSNKEAKKIKDYLDSTAQLAKGAALEALQNGGWTALEQAIVLSIKALKEELIDFFLSGKNEFIQRLKRLLHKIKDILAKQLSNVLDLVKGVFEFIVNALSQAINQVYQLAKNIFELGSTAWKLYKSRNTMSKEELIQKITETIVISGNVTFWASMDLVLETQLTPLTGPFSPILAAFLSALGFGITSHYLNEFVPQIVDWIVGGYKETRQNLEDSAKQLIEASQMNSCLVASLSKYIQSTTELISETQRHTERLDTVPRNKPTVREVLEF